MVRNWSFLFLRTWWSSTNWLLELLPLQKLSSFFKVKFSTFHWLMTYINFNMNQTRAVSEYLSWETVRKLRLLLEGEIFYKLLLNYIYVICFLQFGQLIFCDELYALGCIWITVLNLYDYTTIHTRREMLRDD